MTITFTDGSQASTASEADIFNVTADKHYAVWIFTHNMASGDQLRIKVYVKDQNGAAMRLYRTFTLTDAQTDPAYFVAFLPTKQYQVSIQRLAGTDRTYTWQRVELD